RILANVGRIGHTCDEFLGSALIDRAGLWGTSRPVRSCPLAVAASPDTAFDLAPRARARRNAPVQCERTGRRLRSDEYVPTILPLVFERASCREACPGRGQFPP